MWTIQPLLRSVGDLARLLSALMLLAACGCASLSIQLPERITLREGEPAEIFGSIANTGTPVGGVDVVNGSLPPGLELRFAREETVFTIRGAPLAAGHYEVDLSAWTYGTNFPGDTATKRLIIDVID